MGEITEITDGLLFPEGPVAMPDGSVLVVEMFGERITRVLPDGTKQTVADVAGGPNGLAVGSDGALYLCNNGRVFTDVAVEGMHFPGHFDPARYLGGRIQRVDPATGAVTDLYTECDGRPLRAPNDLVMDDHGGFYFTDHGIRDGHGRTQDLTGIYYARCDGTLIREIAYPALSPNGIGLSPDGTVLYWAETFTGHVFRREIADPGELAPDPNPFLTGHFHTLAARGMADSLGVDARGRVCVATLLEGGITAISPDGTHVEFHPMPDPLTTNICFAGDTAYVTLSATGKLISLPWS